MTDIEQVSDWALSIAAEAAGSKLHHYERMSDDNRLAQSIEAHARAIEQHERFRQEVSDTISELSSEYTSMGSYYADKLRRFIIAKPDPLVEAWGEAWGELSDKLAKLETFRAALAARGFKIVEATDG